MPSPKIEYSEKDDDFSEDENLWLQILNEVQSSPNKLPTSKNLLLLGENGSGKTALISKLQEKSNSQKQQKGHGLTYHLLFVHDEYREDHARLGAYILDGDFAHRSLLRYVLNPETIANTTVLLIASMGAPWDLMETLSSWVTVLEEHIKSLRIPEETFNEHKNRISKQFDNYYDAEKLEGSTSVLGDISLPNKQISVNLGVQIIVVITDSEKIKTLENESEYKDEHFELIQIQLRKFCLKYGAALFYVSTKENRNCDVLLNYLYHRIYSFPFKTQASVLEKDGIFIPAGWDNGNKIAIFVDNLSNTTQSFSDVILKPLNNRKTVNKEVEITSEDDKDFLNRIQTLLSKETPAIVGRPVNTQREERETPIRSSPGVQKTADRRLSGSPSVVSSPKSAKLDSKSGAMAGEGVLQNFFNSLLNRKTGSHTSPIAANAAARSPDFAKSVQQDAAYTTDTPKSDHIPKKTNFPDALKDAEDQDQEEKQVQS